MGNSRGMGTRKQGWNKRKWAEKKRSEEREMDAKKYTRKIPRKVSRRDAHAKGQRENIEGRIRR